MPSSPRVAASPRAPKTRLYFRTQHLRALCLRFALATLLSSLFPSFLESSAVTANHSPQIDEAILRGRIALLAKLPPLVKEPRSDYPVGRICFVLTALLKAGVPSTLPEIRRAFTRTSELSAEKTYDVSCYVFALDALLHRLAKEQQNERRSFLQKDQSCDASQRFDPKILHERMRSLVAWLIGAQNKRRGSWTYGAAPETKRHDFSNTQFAVLALRVALENRIEVPAEVFLGVSSLFTCALQLENEPFELIFQPSSRFEELLGLASPPSQRRARLPPGGWAYRVGSRLKRPGKRPKPPYAAMTAAGASSLVVAIEALRKSAQGRQDTASQWKSSARKAERALHHAYAWIAKHFDQFFGDRRKLFYDLYSLEKVGDLAGIDQFGGRDWYIEGSKRLVAEQKQDGSWGSYINTAFALLFLTRATRALNPTSSPIIYTGRQDSKDAQPPCERFVYLESANGFVSATAVLDYIATSRNPKLIKVGKRIVRNYHREKEELVGVLLDMWQSADRISTFARNALRDITKEFWARKSRYEIWHREYMLIRSLRHRSAMSANELAKWFAKTDSPVLKTHLVRLATQFQHHSLCRLLIDELRTESEGYRHVVHATLAFWTGADIDPPPKQNRRGWRNTYNAWKRWWKAEGRERWGRH